MHLRLFRFAPLRLVTAMAAAGALLCPAGRAFAQTATVSTMAQLRTAVGNSSITTININPGTYLLTSSGSGPLIITRNLTITNTGGGRVVLNAAGASRVIVIDGNYVVTLTGLTITGGSTGDEGGGILANKSTLTLQRTTVSGNVASGAGGGIHGDGGSLILVNSTVSGNQATAGSDGGGGIYSKKSDLTVTNSTIAANTAPAGTGGGIYDENGLSFTLRNTIVSGNTGGEIGGRVTPYVQSSNGRNVVLGGCSGCLPSDITANPLLGGLQDNGGDSHTHALLAGSPAIDSALAAHAPATDQRGIVRPQGTAADIGAFEFTPPTLSSAVNQIFPVNDPVRPISTITITESSGASITAANDIRIRIPAGLSMTWDTTDLSAVIGGAAAGKVSSTVSYEDGGKTLVLDVTSNFAAGDQITVSGLAFASFTAPSAAARLELEVGNDDSVAATDDKTITIIAAGVPRISSEFDQSFRVGDAPITISTITITDDPVTRSITAAYDIRIRIPAGLNMSWDTSDNTATILGTAAGKVSSTVSYEDGGKTLVIDVLTDFAPNDIITISGLSFRDFTAASPDDNLELEARNDGVVSAEDDKGIFIVFIAVTPNLSSADDQSFTVGDPVTEMVSLRVTDDPFPQITAANDIRIRIPNGLSMIWDTTNVLPTLSGRGRSNVSTTVSYEDGGKTLVINVVTNFVANDWLNVKGLSFMNFTSASLARRLELEVYNDGVANTSDTRTKTIFGPTYDVVVVPDTQAASHVPSNGTTYTVDFTVANVGSITSDYDLLTAKIPGGTITVVSITGPGVTQGADPDSARLASLGSGLTASVTVTYAVASVAAGTTDTLVLTARSVADPAKIDDARLVLVVVRPNLTVGKAVDPSGTVLPGTDLTYTVTVTNTGSDDAVNMVAVDSLAVELEFKPGSILTNLPPGVTLTVEYSDDGGATWAYTPASLGCGAPTDYDGCVTHIRWTLQNNLGSVAPDNTGSFTYVARVK